MNILVVLTIFFVFCIVIIYQYWNQISAFLASKIFVNENVIRIKNKMRSLAQDIPEDMDSILENKIDINKGEIQGEKQEEIMETKQEETNIYMDKIRWIVKQPFDWLLWIKDKYIQPV